jgi:Tol biopolymer transport system component
MKTTKKAGKILAVGLLGAALVLGTTAAQCVSMPGGIGGTDATIVYERTTVLDIKRITDDGLSKDWLTVSPNGKMILYCDSLTPVKKTDISNPRVKSYRVMLLKDAMNAVKTQLVTDNSTAPAWYNDNNTFVYSLIDNGKATLVRSNISGGGKLFITRNPIGLYDTRSTVKGTTLLFDTEINKKSQIVSATDKGGDVTVLGDGEAPIWSPVDQQKYVFVRDDSIWEMDLRTSQPSQLFSDSKFRAKTPKYADDGKYILFQKECEVQVIDSKSGKTQVKTHWHLFSIKSDGTGLLQLTDGDVDVYSPSWGSGNRIFFISTAGGSPEIWTATVNLE